MINFWKTMLESNMMPESFWCAPLDNNNIYSTENPIINQPIISYNQYDSNNSNIIY